MSAKKILEIAAPTFLGRELDYVSDVIGQRRLSMGVYVSRFATLIESSLGVEYAVPVSSGTAALHVALLALGVRPGDHVVVPDCSYIATANAVRYCGATPVFVDVEPDTWTLNADSAVIAAERWRAVGVITVNLFGAPCTLPNVPGRWILEDLCESPGTRLRGDVGVLSFYGNKIVTTGEGGAVVTNRKDIADRVTLLRGQGTSGVTRYVHEVLGFNYRLTDLQAAIGCAQFEELDEHLRRRAMLRRVYEQLLPEGIRRQIWNADSVDWVMPICVPCDRDRVAEILLREYDVETRPVFPPLHSQPYLQTCPRFCPGGEFFVSEELAKTGLLLPLHLGLTISDIAWICKALRSTLERV